ncbi:MAG: response regulator [Archangiaceae bacterium]|nr:response regulator [Archangiaceae bacterium]
MLRVWNRLLDWSTPPDAPSADQPRARVFAIILWLALVLSGLSALLAALSELWVLSSVNLVDVLTAGLVLWWFRTHPWSTARTSVNGFLWAFLPALSLGTLATTPIDLSNLGYLLLLPLVSAAVLDAAATRKWFLRTIIVGTAVSIAGHLDFVVPHVDPMPAVTHVMNFISILTAAMALMHAVANERERSLERVREAERVKSAFFANVGHEIRTPLNGVLGMADALLTHPLGSDEREMVQIIRSSGTVLHALIDDVLDLSKLEAQQLELHPAPVSLRALTDELRGLWTPMAHRKALALEVHADDDLPQAVLVDGLRLRQVLNNLLNNAVKFTERGSVGLRLSQHAGQLHFVVTDTGIGITPEQQQRLFQRFVQADDSRARSRQGTGLGLALSKQLTELMGGALTLESKVGEGSTFTCLLPLKATAMPERQPPVRATDLGRLRVLVVDDNAVNRLVAQRLLDKSGCEVTVAADGPSALAAVARQSFDVVLMDVHMPEMDGLEVTRRIRASSHEATRIIGLSASADREDVEACRSAGMNDFLAKPLTQERLVAALGRRAA